mmetsp:Transcript_3243/g.3195  ORF Transcript_3243/g.3195 Transcript_3243/m.3195 type:complete len:168 (-) Transcript_3243:131-634(-)
MILPKANHKEHLGDFNHFIHDKDEDVYKLRSIRNCCLDLISSLIEVFGDLAVESILYVIDNHFFFDGSNPGSQANAGNPKSTSLLAKSVEEINIYEFVYNSKNKLHYWKKSEVALYLVGNFAEDISMYRQRNRDYNLKGLIEQILKIDFNQAMMKGYLKGRTLWCAS